MKTTRTVNQPGWVHTKVSVKKSAPVDERPKPAVRITKVFNTPARPDRFTQIAAANSKVQREANAMVKKRAKSNQGTKP